jgi:uncharacterized protein (TIGR03083 family)
MTPNDVLSARCELLAEAWGWWGRTLEALDDESWTRSTRLEGWDVAALVAHHGFLVQAIGLLAARPVDTEPAIASARDMLRRFNEPSGVATTAAAAVAEIARQQAASLTHDDLVARFVTEAPASVEALRGAGPIVIEYFGNGTFPIAEAAAIAIMEAVVHGLDLCDAVEALPGSIPEGATRFTTELLASLPDPFDFIEAATGRAPAHVLPVLR